MVIGLPSKGVIVVNHTGYWLGKQNRLLYWQAKTVTGLSLSKRGLLGYQKGTIMGSRKHVHQIGDKRITEMYPGQGVLLQHLQRYPAPIYNRISGVKRHHGVFANVYIFCQAKCIKLCHWYIKLLTYVGACFITLIIETT